MFKLILISYLCYASLAHDTCFHNIGNKRSSHSSIIEIVDSTFTLDDCKAVCDQWVTVCSSYDDLTSDDCASSSCLSGVLTEEGCTLYAYNDDWYLTAETTRDQAFEVCDATCWVEYNGREPVNTQESNFAVYEGVLSTYDCQGKCEDHNHGCIVDADCDDYCFGVTHKNENCYLTHELDVEADLEYSNDENAHYRQYTCDIEVQDADDQPEIVEPEPETESSIHIIDPNEEEPELEPEDEDDDEELDDTDFGGEQEEEEGQDDDYTADCTVATVYSECDYQGETAIVNRQVFYLDWEPKSWCVPVHQILHLHNEYNLEGEKSSYATSEPCVEDIEYSFLQMNRLKKRAIGQKSVSTTDK